MNEMPWDQRIARVLVRPLVQTPIRPNHVTAATAIIALAGAVLIALRAYDWGAGLFVLSRFLDHFDGELARLQHTTSKLGYYLDYASGGFSYSALFLGLGLGFWTELGPWSAALGLTGAASASISVFSNLAIDRKVKDIEKGEAIGYPGFAGFELEDGIYLLAPVTWLGYLEPFFIAAGIGAGIYTLWTISRAIRL
jgi:phosphatidylglycerophosphate synthase